MAAKARLERALQGAAMGADTAGNPSGNHTMAGLGSQSLSAEDEDRLAVARHTEEVRMWKRRRAEAAGTVSSKSATPPPV